MNLEKNDLSLLIINASSPSIDEDGDIAVPTIQKLIDSGITDDIREYYTGESPLRHSGQRENRAGKREFEIGYVLGENIILAGGLLCNEHYQLFVFMLQQMQQAGTILNIHMPLNCTYGFESRYDSGESWTDGCLISSESEGLRMYKEAMQQYASRAYILRENGQVAQTPKLAALNLWGDWEKMVNYLNQLIQGGK